MQKRVGFKIKGKKIYIGARKCGFFNSGLMFRTSNTMPCLFEFNEPIKFKITSFFVFFPFVAIWLDKRNGIIRIKKVKPFTFAEYPGKPFSKLLEIPVNRRYEEKIKLLVGD